MIQVKSREVSNKLSMMVLEQLGDTTTDTSNQVIADTIREKFKVDVDNQFIEEFMQGLGMQLTMYINMLVMQSVSVLLFELLGAAKLKNLLKKNASKGWKYFKDILSHMPGGSGKKANVFDVVQAKGTSQEVAVLEDIRSIMDAQMVYSNILETAKTTSIVTSNLHNGSIQADKNVNGESTPTGAGEYTKSTEELKVMSSIGL